MQTEIGTRPRSSRSQCTATEQKLAGPPTQRHLDLVCIKCFGLGTALATVSCQLHPGGGGMIENPVVIIPRSDIRRMLSAHWKPPKSFQSQQTPANRTCTFRGMLVARWKPSKSFQSQETPAYRTSRISHHFCAHIACARNTCIRGSTCLGNPQARPCPNSHSITSIRIGGRLYLDYTGEQKGASFGMLPLCRKNRISSQASWRRPCPYRSGIIFVPCAVIRQYPQIPVIFTIILLDVK